ncbi:MltA-interacting protein precursor [Photorhabdus australis subsp. thailandensis]|uniref:MltA-interacting protein n=1 Tax=Photorhabdus australis subsp. thailandensis TaxID=2805096 RepID=A0A1C0U4Y3_9GAMM|nr:MipA/OmpV family protein [Photorhabdus australis]OCQ52953.1 MltA-interacting protein precursor [Photorhabdus australis subsp. thailandensis]
MANKVKILAAVAAFCLSSSVAYAGQWSIGASVLAEASPYKGVKNKDKVLPVPMVNYESEDFYFHTLAAGYYLWNQPKDQLSLDVYYYPQNFRPKDNKDEQMKKLDRRRDTIMGGFSYRHIEDWGTLRSSFAADTLGKSKGVTVDLAYLYSFENDDWSLQPGLGVVWSSKKQNRYEYGIKGSESRRSGLEKYTPGDSWTPYLELSASYKFNQKWSAFVMGRIERLPDEIKDSPMVNKSYSSIAWAGITYSF